MEIIDAQIHLPHALHEFAEQVEPEIRGMFGVELARESMDSVGVDAAVLSANLATVTTALAMYPDRFAGCVSYDATADPDPYIASLRATPGIVGLRVFFIDWKTTKPLADFTAGKLEPFLAAAEKHDLPVFCMAMGGTKYLEPVASAHPGLTLILDHFGLPSPPPMGPVTPDPFDTLGDVIAIARHPNVSLKFTGVTCLSKAPYPHRELWPQLHQIIEAFGTDRLMWGSDYTRLRMGWGTAEQGPRPGWMGTYAENVHFLRETTEVSESDKEKMFGASLRRILRWPGPQETGSTKAS
jgi:predicted TIM-barrel fold metal-dependent hydrolase